MLADTSQNVRAGRLDTATHLPAEAKRAVVDFIAAELPNWRDHADRSSEHAETRLTEQLCDYLNSAMYDSKDWNHIQFRTETGDEKHASRTVDMAAKPLGKPLMVEGRRHNIFDTIFPIECKRLPTPSDSRRDEREYVFSRHSSTGGMQRFKAGLHGSRHAFAAMIGYVQAEDSSYWAARVNEWVNALIASKQAGWTDKDLVNLESCDSDRKTAMLGSSHMRDGNLSEIELRHLWVEMS